MVANSDYFDLPFIDCSHAESNYDLGYCIGTNTQKQTTSRWNDWSMAQSMLTWIETNKTGQQIYNDFLTNNQLKFPLYIEEGRGIADGANISFKQIFIMVCASFLIIPFIH